MVAPFVLPQEIWSFDSGKTNGVMPAHVPQQSGMKQDREYLILIDFLARLLESTKGTELDAETLWLADTQPLAAKFLMHCGSIFHLAHGSIIPNILGKTLSYLDNHSIFVLVRTVHELHLAFNFIYVAPATVEEKAFRHKVWELGAFLDRQKFPMTEEENIKKQQSERAIVDQLTQAIQSYAVFNSLRSGQKNKAIKGEWRLGYQWVDLAEFAILDEEQFRSTYRYLCSYAHTGHLSIFQMQRAADISKTISLTETWIDSVMGVISHFIYDYMKVYPKTVELFKQYPKAEELAYIHDGLGRKPIDANGDG